MKIKLSPDMSYIIGLWKYNRTREGIGIVGGEEERMAFSAAALRAGLAEASHLQLRGDRVFFYHTAYRNFFDLTLERQDEAFCHLNDYAAAFFGGLFDAVGGVREGIPYLMRCDKKDEMALLRLGFRLERAGGVAAVMPGAMFLKFIKHWQQVPKRDESGMNSATERPIILDKPVVRRKKRIFEP